MKYAVTGGGGFVGRAICTALRRQGHEVIAIGRNRYPDLEAAGVKCVQADVAGDPAPLFADLHGADAIFHTAAKVAMWGEAREFERVNISGTRNVIRACRECGVPKLIFTSSPSVVANGKDLRGVDERQPYPQRYEAHYPRTKAQAEQEVLAANSPGLKTIALRPHLIWGPGDTNLAPTIIRKAADGRLLRVGRGKNLVDLTYIDDCAAAHLRARDALDDNPRCRGRAFFISQGEPVLLWKWINEVLRRSGMPPVTRSIPRAAASAAAAGMEWAARAGLVREPRFTRFLVSEMATDHYFDISAARRELGYQPKVSVAEGLERTFPQQPAAEGRSPASGA